MPVIRVIVMVMMFVIIPTMPAMVVIIIPLMPIAISIDVDFSHRRWNRHGRRSGHDATGQHNKQTSC
jgi:hypothetical protein